MSDLFPDTRRREGPNRVATRGPPWRKLYMVGQMYRTVRNLAARGVRQRYPNARPGELRRHLANLLMGEELASRVFGTLQNRNSP